MFKAIKYISCSDYLHSCKQKMFAIFPGGHVTFMIASLCTDNTKLVPKKTQLTSQSLYLHDLHSIEYVQDLLKDFTKFLATTPKNACLDRQTHIAPAPHMNSMPCCVAAVIQVKGETICYQVTVSNFLALHFIQDGLVHSILFLVLITFVLEMF